MPQRVIAVALLGALGCGATPATDDARVGAPPTCPAALRSAWTDDSLIHVCIPSTFVARGSHGFGLPMPAPSETVVFVTASGHASWRLDEPWPLHLATTTAEDTPDGITVDAWRSVPDTVAGVAVVVEMGLVSGGLQGLQRAPSLLIAAEPRASVRLVVQGFAPDTASLSVLRQIARTVWIAPLAGRPRPAS